MDAQVIIFTRISAFLSAHITFLTAHFDFTTAQIVIYCPLIIYALVATHTGFWGLRSN